MKKLLKITGLFFLFLILGIGALYLYFTGFGRIKILSATPRKPKIEVPVTYTIDWWSNQNTLAVDSFNVGIVESKLNLFNSQSLVFYKVCGHLTYKGHWQPKIEEVHISERLNTDTLLHCDRIIEITPVVKTINNENTTGGSDLFSIKNEHTIKSNHWGKNRIKFVCGKHEKTIELMQRK